MLNYEKRESFGNISQRVLYGLNFTYSDFSPVKSEYATEQAQKELHDLLHSIIEKLYDHPELLNLPVIQDESYPWWLCNNQKPDLNKVYMSIFKNLYEFYRLLFVIGQVCKISGNSIKVKTIDLKEGKVIIKPFHITFLKDLNIVCEKGKEECVFIYSGTDGLFSALKLLSDISKESLFNFVCCSYNCDYSYLLSRLETFFKTEKDIIKKLEYKCIEKGYKTHIRGNITTTGFDFSVRFQNNIGGFIFQYNPRKIEQIRFGTINGIGAKAMLEDFNNLDSDLQKHFIENCGRCRGCKGCTKGGNSKVFTVSVKYQGEDILLCPQFPNSCWDTVDNLKIETLFKYHDLQEKYSDK